ncbi:MAG TPA: anti-sigma factor [Steroidobacteraceae bacterium]|nr:anti-sigma factor [Steroidobacteraceae bacterium]
MNYQRPQLIEELAAQYVLGTLRGRARHRFERLCARDAKAFNAVQRWEDRLVDLLAGVVPVAPSALVWDRIKFRVRRESKQKPKKAFATFGNWRFAAAAGIAALAIAFGLWSGFGPGSAQQLANFVDQQQVQLWTIEAPRDRDELRISAADNLALDPARAYELWALPGEGAAPVSLGLMPRSGRGTLQLNDAQRLALSRSRQIAISLEPWGGSPTGAPTGPVLYVAEVAAAG